MSYNQNSGYGRALIDALSGVIPAFGRVFVVMSSSDAGEERYDRVREVMKPYRGVTVFCNTVEDAYDKVTSNNNDIILLDGDTAHSVSAMMTIAKNRVHFIGMDGGRRFGYQGARIVLGVTGVATDLAPVLTTGVRNTFRNIKFENASTTDESLYGFIENGEGTYIENCSFVKSAGLNDAGHAHFWMAGDSLNMKDCLIGQSNTPNTGAGYGILIDGKAGGGAGGVVKENILENIYVYMSVGGSVQGTSCFIKIADNAAMNFGNVINGITATNFIPVGGTIMTDAVLAASSTVAGALSITGASWFGVTGVGGGSGKGVSIANKDAAADADGGLATTLTD